MKAAQLANVLVHRKGFASLWSYVASKSTNVPVPPRTEGGEQGRYPAPEMYVEKYTPTEWSIFYLLVLEELANKCREALMMHDQDLTARGSWTPLPSPSSMGTGLHEEATQEANERHQVVAAQWAPSLRRYT